MLATSCLPHTEITSLLLSLIPWGGSRYMWRQRRSIVTYMAQMYRPSSRRAFHGETICSAQGALIATALSEKLPLLDLAGWEKFGNRKYLSQENTNSQGEKKTKKQTKKTIFEPCNHSLLIQQPFLHSMAGNGCLPSKTITTIAVRNWFY